MTANAIVAGTFADLKTVKSRSVVQMVIEIPIERGASVVEMFGFPQPGAEIAVAVARLVGTPPAAEPDAPGKRRFEDMPRAQQAGILCSEREFQRWLGVNDAGEAAARIRVNMGVASRSDLDRVGPAWDALVTDYRIWQRYGDMR